MFDFSRKLAYLFEALLLSFRSRNISYKETTLKTLPFCVSLWRKKFIDTIWRPHLTSGNWKKNSVASRRLPIKINIRPCYLRQWQIVINEHHFWWNNNLLMQAILSACSYKALLCFQNLITIPGNLLQRSNKITQCLILLVIQVNLHTLVMFLLQSGTFQLSLLIICFQWLLEVLQFSCKITMREIE